MMKHINLIALFAVILLHGMRAGPSLAQTSADHIARMKASQALFKSQVKPILKAHCLNCHGGKSTKGDFDLSSRATMLDSGFVDLEDPKDSQILAVIRHETEPHMPMKSAKLSQKQIEEIGKWIALGAAYDAPFRQKLNGSVRQVTDTDREFWAFRSLDKVEVPQIEDPWVRTDIDRFLRVAQDEVDLAPNPEADRRTLIRRATFDLLGLPPKPEEVVAFVNDPDPQAYERLIDRLLESPHFGERWARHWMDVARFAESHGYEQDYDRPNAYHYRDFLIRAFNDDLPYDRFVSWQLAGDELDHDNALAMMATGFIGAGVFPTQLTEVEFESARYDELDDIVATTGVAFLGLSIGCARCHDHKYDPIPTGDYYRVAANFTKTIRSEIQLELDPAKNRENRAAHARELAMLEAKAKRFEAENLDAEFRQWLADFEPDKSDTIWQSATVVNVTSSAGSKYEYADDGAILALGKGPDKETITIRMRVEMSRVAALRLEALRHDSLPKGGPGRADNGNFALGELHLSHGDLSGEKFERLILKNARATHQQNSDALSVAASIDNDPISGWAVDLGGIGKDQAAVFDLAVPVENAKGHLFSLKMRFDHPNARHSLGRFRISFADTVGQTPIVGQGGMPRSVVKALAALKRDEVIDRGQRQQAIEWFVGHKSKLRALRQAVEKKRGDGPTIKKSLVQVSSEGLPHMKHHADGRGYPHFYPETYVLSRGDVHQKVEVATPGYLQVLMRGGRAADDWRVDSPDGWDRTGFSRASMANWLTDVEFGAGNLVARVVVNRLWQHHFGQGLVATPNDFGFSGERPTHPDLLDWMARDLVDHGWKLKRLHRLIMTSAAYRQSTVRRPDHDKRDSDNRLHARRVPRRLEGEAIRDAILSVSGQLDETMYGKGTLNSSMRRRSVYFFVKRSKLIPEMMLFDWPESLVSIGQRATTTTAPQALMFMNSSVVRAAAVGLADRLQDRSDNESIHAAYEWALGRPPTEPESRRAMQFLTTQMVAHGTSAQAQRLARADFFQVLFSLNEFIYVR